MAEPASQRSLNRVWILVLVVIVLAWIIYALTGGTSPPKTTTGADSAPAQQR
jgi:dipeptide/tripeptide permease